MQPWPVSTPAASLIAPHAWREVFAALEWAEHQGWITIERENRSIESLQLTEEGANKIQEKMDSKRGLFKNL